MARNSTAQTVQPTFRITDDASMDAFLTALGLSRPERGGLPMIAAMRTAADKGFAFTVDGYRPSEAAPKSENYTIVFKAPKGASHPGGEGTIVLTLDTVKELAGVSGDKRGRTGVNTFELAVAAKLGEDPDYVKAQSIIGDAAGARDLCVPVTRKGKASTASAEDSDGDADAEDNGDDVQDGEGTEDAGTEDGDN